jgi:hypothetical protein
VNAGVVHEDVDARVSSLEVSQRGLDRSRIGHIETTSFDDSVFRLQSCHGAGEPHGVDVVENDLRPRSR